MGRDPIEEKGGLNLYGFCGNNSVNRWDLLGMFAWYYTGPDGQMYSTMPHITDSPGDFLSMDREAALRAASAIDGMQYAAAAQLSIVTAVTAANNLSAILNSTGAGAALAMNGVISSNMAAIDAQFAMPGSFIGTTAPNNAAGNYTATGPLSLGTFNMAQTPFPTNNSGGPIIVVTPGGNALPVPAGGTLTGSPNGRYIQVRNPDGSESGTRIDGGHHPSSHPDPRAQGPHAHVPGATNPDGTPWLPVRPEPVPLVTGNQVLGGAAVIGGGYLIYRGARMVPSLFPPLWWTIPINAGTP